MERQEYDREFGGAEEPEIVESELEEGQQEEPEQPEEHSEPAEGEHIEHEPPRKKEVSPQKLKTRLNQVQRERYQALEALSRLQEENERLRHFANTSAEVAQSQYELNVQNSLARARQMKADALESGDTQAIIDADIELNIATQNLNEATMRKAQQAYQEQQQVYQEPEADPYEVHQDNLRRWVGRNDWFNPDSDRYDEWLANEVNLYSAQFNNNLMQNGLGHQIGSPDYTAVLDNHAAALMQYRQQQTKPRRDLNMRSPRGPVSPVRNSYASGQRSRETKPLSADERDIARRMGVDDNTYRKYKEIDIRENSHRRGGY